MVKSFLGILFTTILKCIGVVDVQYNANSVQLNLTTVIDLSTSFLKLLMCQIDWFKLVYHYYGCGRSGLIINVWVEIIRLMVKKKSKKMCVKKNGTPNPLNSAKSQ